jgi:hypothetical protein
MSAPLKVIEVKSAARLAAAGIWPDGMLVGVTPGGHPLRVKYGTVMADCREASRVR